ncbi:hypothetical protein TanjilG_16187 [Lupinus angustifolius]|uniref:BHLH domain-containing protein n=1 Tax=Lupinus angustifolius TaxID=3871 RepID=A0A1J7HAE7_LUPAN|nr:PREDICTED: transcription factor bHLH51-like [Lupinus angustifolius]OIV97426.1 hypothetical protein TanjilG_16187 [Lupinus angustifolius]
MENYYDSGFHIGTNLDECSDHSPFLVPTQILPHVSNYEGAAKNKITSASKSHSQAEKRRRDRINTQLASLRKLIPKSDKMDKAALLGSVIDHVKDLKRKANDIVSSRDYIVPTEFDEITIDYDHVQDEKSTTKVNKFKDNFNIKASVCCDDRPELFAELIQVLKGWRLTAVKADIVSVGGRIKSILVLCSKDSEESVCISTLKQSLKSALTKIVSNFSMASNYSTRSKRQRSFFPSHCL